MNAIDDKKSRNVFQYYRRPLAEASANTFAVENVSTSVTMPQSA